MAGFAILADVASPFYPRYAVWDERPGGVRDCMLLANSGGGAIFPQIRHIA